MFSLPRFLQSTYYSLYQKSQVNTLILISYLWLCPQKYTNTTILHNKKSAKPSFYKRLSALKYLSWLEYVGIEPTQPGLNRSIQFLRLAGYTAKLRHTIRKVLILLYLNTLK